MSGDVVQCREYVGSMGNRRQIRGLLIDLDGVLYIGQEVVRGAREALGRLTAAGMQLRYLTNTTTRTAHEVATKLKTLGFGISESEIYSAVTATREFLKAHPVHGGSPSLHLLVRQSVMSEFAGFPHASLETGDGAPDYVVMGDIGAAWSYPLLNTVFNEIMKGSKLLAMHRNKYWQTEDGLRMDIGAFVIGLEYVTGREATVIGKPSRDFFKLAVNALGVPPDQVAMVGDDIEADVGGGQAAGLRGVLVQTGKYRAETAARSSVQPDAELASIADLPGWLGLD